MRETKKFGVATYVCHLVESENTKFLRFEYYKQIATATFVRDRFYNVKTAKNRPKKPIFTKNIIYSLNVSVKQKVKACWKAESPHNSIKC